MIASCILVVRYTSNSVSPSSTDTFQLTAMKEKAHTDNISSVNFAPNNNTIVSACYGGTIKVWHAGESLQFSPSYHPLPSDTLIVCRAASLELKTEKQNAHSDWIQSVAFSPDGKTIVSGSDDETIRVWDAGESF